MAHFPEVRAKVVAAVIAGMTQRQAAKQFGVAASTVEGWCGKSVQNRATRKRKPTSGELAREKEYHSKLDEFLEVTMDTFQAHADVESACGAAKLKGVGLEL